MKMFLPTTLDEALRVLAKHPHCRPVAGGTDLFVHWPARRLESDAPLLDLSAISRLKRVEDTANGLVLGGLTTYWDVLSQPDLCQRFPLLEQAARQTGAIQIQARGTWAGNVANASPSADGVMALMASGAIVELSSLQSVRRVSLDAFFRGYRETDLRPGELITALRVPAAPEAEYMFEKVGGRRAQTISRVGLAIELQPSRCRVAVNSMAPTVMRCPSLERALLKSEPPKGPGEWLALIQEDLAPIDDHRASGAYRQKALSRILAAWSQRRVRLKRNFELGVQ